MASNGAEGANAPIDDLIPKGLTPEQLCEEYFKACQENNSLRWLAAVHPDRRAGATSKSPGPFFACAWEEGRTRVEKYSVKYKFEGQVGGTTMEGYDPVVHLNFQPVYGEVPGYTAGHPLGPRITLTLRKLGGVNGEWRVMDGAF